MQQLVNFTSFWNGFPLTDQVIQTTLGLIIISLWLAFRVYKKTNYALGLVFFLSCFSGIISMTFPNHIYTKFGVVTRSAMGSICGGALTYLILFGVLTAFLNFRWVIKNLILALIFADIFGLIFKLFFGHDKFPYNDPWFLLSNGAMDATLIGISLPLIKKEFKGWTVFLAAFAMIITKSSTGLALLLIFSAFSFSWWLLPLGGLGFFLIGKSSIFDSSGRFPVWKLAMNFWKTDVNPLLGTGLGTYGIFGPALQINAQQSMAPGQKIDLFQRMHNDWLQSLFELGAVTAGFLLVGYILLLKKSWNRPWLRLSWILFGFSGLTQMPLHYFITSLFGVYLICETYECPNL